MALSNSGYSFTWKLENFSYIIQNDLQYIESPSFYPNTVSDLTLSEGLTLQFYPTGISVNTSLAGEDEAVLLVNDFDLKTYECVLSEIVTLRKEEVVPLEKLNPNEFVLKQREFIDILKNNEDIVTFILKLQLKDGVNNGKEFSGHDKEVTKAEIHRECLKTTLNFLTADEHRISVECSHFVINLRILDGYFKVRIELKEKEKQIQRIRHLSGKFLLVGANSPDIVTFDVQKCFNGHDSETEWISRNYKIESECIDTFYFSYDIETSGLRSKYLEEYRTDALRRGQSFKDHLRYVYATNMYPDIVIRVKGTDIAAHQIVLTSRSPVFAELLKNECCVVEINDYDMITVIKFLDFLYCDELVEYDSKQVIKLCCMAEIYEVGTLAAKCMSLYNKLKSNPSVQEKLPKMSTKMIKNGRF